MFSGIPAVHWGEWSENQTWGILRERALHHHGLYPGLGRPYHFENMTRMSSGFRLYSITARITLLISGLALAVSWSPANAASQAPGTPSSSQAAARDSAAVVSAIDSFHRALETGDTTAVVGLLAADATVLESGGVETRQEYLAHHLPADIAFAQAVSSERGPMRVVVRGDVAWAMSTSATKGEYRGRPVDSVSAELMVLLRTTAGWKISAIHWSSRNRTP
jgi:ketosteroid isomerase-like protein